MFGCTVNPYEYDNFIRIIVVQEEVRCKIHIERKGFYVVTVHRQTETTLEFLKFSCSFRPTQIVL
jgi:hypothetical protein